MSLGVQQHVMGVVYELLHIKDVCGYKEAQVQLGYDLEAILIVPQAYITLRTHELNGSELIALTEAVRVAFVMVHGDEVVAKLPLDQLANDLFEELKFVHNQLIQAAADGTPA